MLTAAFAVQVFDRLMDGRIEHGCVMECAMSEVMTLQIPPAQFDVVELRRVTRQPLDGYRVVLGKS
ncbi:MAG: hypothetical protein ACJ8AI_24165, partial [Rhodopila sp.]